jgi:hypothetical protein
MNETLEKIKNGTIRIEQGNLTGLGMNGNESIDIEELDELIDSCGNSGCIGALSKTITAIANILSFTNAKEDGEIKNFVNEWVISELPDYYEISMLKRLIDVFNTYRP